MGLLLLAAALIGHADLMAGAVNRLHGYAMPRWILRGITRAMLVWTLAAPLGILAWFLLARVDPFHPAAWWRASPPIACYLCLCWTALAVDLCVSLGRVLLARKPASLRRETKTRLRRLVPADASSHPWAAWPLNEILDLEIVERELTMPRLPATLDGLSIWHLSDLHFSGRIAKSFVEEVIARCNAMPADLALVTGDIIEKADRVDWIPDTLGKLAARCGKFFVLGNHDQNADPARIRNAMVQSGWTDLGGRWLEVPVGDGSVVLAGNELPWFAPAPDLSRAGAFRIALAHSPDQLAWARANGVDLLLAGHVHGGQFRLPIVGPILSPSRHGVKYAMGVFDAPRTVLHVSAGLGGKIPFRLRCPPEAARLILRSQDAK